MIKLTQLLKESSEEKRPLSLEVKKHFLEIVSTYNKYQESLDRKSDIQEIAETLGGITEAARTLAIHESDDWFDKHTVKRNMSELDKLGKQFDKVAVEAKGLDQRMAGLYEDMGHILSRYYKMGEITEDQMKERLGLKEGVSKEAMGIAGFTGTRGSAVQKFIDDYNLDARKLFNFVKKGKLKDRMDFVTAIAGKSGNNKQGKMVGMFGESVNESKSDCGCGCGGVTKGGCNDK